MGLTLINEIKYIQWGKATNSCFSAFNRIIERVVNFKVYTKKEK